MVWWMTSDCTSTSNGYTITTSAPIHSRVEPWVARKVARSALPSQSTSSPMKSKNRISSAEMAPVSTDISSSHGNSGRE